MADKRLRWRLGFVACAGKTKGTLAGTCGIQCDETRLMARIKFADKGAVKIRVGSFTPEAAAAAADPAARWSLGVYDLTRVGRRP
jgi:hypothetical protein